MQSQVSGTFQDTPDIFHIFGYNVQLCTWLFFLVLLRCSAMYLTFDLEHLLGFRAQKVPKIALN